MNREETIRIIKRLSDAYPHIYENMTKDKKLGVVHEWQQCFSTRSFEEVNAAVSFYIKASKFHPAISEIIEYVNKERYRREREEAREARRANHKKIMELLIEREKQNEETVYSNPARPGVRAGIRDNGQSINQ